MEDTAIPAINPALVPTIAPGRLFTRFTTDGTLNVRWLTAKDPAYFEVLNRPNVDIALRQLILSKAIDNLYASLGHEALYPYLVQPRVAAGNDQADVPLNWIWSLNLALPMKWEKPRLARIKRIRGTNDDTGGYTGALRVVFSASLVTDPTEIELFWADYQIDSVLTFQVCKLHVVTYQEETNPISPDEAYTVAGAITFLTLDTTTLINSTFLDLVAAPDSSVGTDGNYHPPAIYEIVDTVGGGAGAVEDFSMIVVRHGTGVLTESAWTGLPPQESDAQAWIHAMNYPFDLMATRASADNVILPQGLFREFLLVVPAGDEPSGTQDDSTFPVWVNAAQFAPPPENNRNHVRLFFATYNNTEAETGGTPSLQAIQFAYLDLYQTGPYALPGTRLQIVPYHNLMLDNNPLDTQHFGRGHVVLSSLWTNTTTDITDFWTNMASLQEAPQITTFNQASTRISSFGMHAVPRYTPTQGQSRALLGTTSYLASPIVPSEHNRFVVEQDQGLGNTIDCNNAVGPTGTQVASLPAIERYGYTGSLCHRLFKLVVYADQLPADANFYTAQILPRIRVLLGRDPVFGDIWYNGTRFVTFNGDSWQD